MKLVLASKNPHKLEELQAILDGLGVEVLLESDAGVDVEVEETGATFEENARIKAEAVMKASGLPAVADDSGLCVDALNGAPGVFSARYGGEGLNDVGRYRLLMTGGRNSSPASAAAFLMGRSLRRGESAPVPSPTRPRGAMASGTTRCSLCPV